MFYRVKAVFLIIILIVVAARLTLALSSNTSTSAETSSPVVVEKLALQTNLNGSALQADDTTPNYHSTDEAILLPSIAPIAIPSTDQGVQLTDAISTVSADLPDEFDGFSPSMHAMNDTTTSIVELAFTSPPSNQAFTTSDRTVSTTETSAPTSTAIGEHSTNLNDGTGEEAVEEVHSTTTSGLIMLHETATTTALNNTMATSEESINSSRTDGADDGGYDSQTTPTISNRTTATINTTREPAMTSLWTEAISTEIFTRPTQPSDESSPAVTMFTTTMMAVTNAVEGYGSTINEEALNASNNNTGWNLTISSSYDVTTKDFLGHELNITTEMTTMKWTPLSTDNESFSYADFDDDDDDDDGNSTFTKAIDTTDRYLIEMLTTTVKVDAGRLPSSHATTLTPTSVRTTPASTLTTSRASTTERDFTCANGTSYLFHPYDCQKYIQCSNGRKYDMRCPRGLFWNPQLARCDWSDEHCRNMSSLSPLIDASCASGIDYTAHPISCHQFIQCDHGRASVRTCPPLLKWNNKDKTCDWSDKYCNYKSESRCNGGVPVHFADLNDCRKYIRCIGDVEIHLQCGHALYWNPMSERCEPDATQICTGTAVIYKAN